MKAMLQQYGDEGLMFEDLNSGDDFVFTNQVNSRVELDKPAVKLDLQRYHYHGGGVVYGQGTQAETSKLKVARIRATSEVVFVLDTGDQS